MSPLHGHLQQMEAELTDAVSDIIKKYSESRLSTRVTLQRIQLFPMCQAELSHWHCAIMRSLKRPTRTVDPWGIRIQRDVPEEIFNAILAMTTTNMFGCSVKTTRATVTVVITVLEKLKTVLNFMNCGRSIPVHLRSKMLTKKLMSGETAEVLVTEDTPFTFKYSRNSGYLVITAKFGLWNSHGIPQHV